MSMGLRPHRFACERCEQPAPELHFTYINRQPCHVCHDCLRALIAANVARVAARARAAGRLGGEVSAGEGQPCGHAVPAWAKVCNVCEEETRLALEARAAARPRGAVSAAEEADWREYERAAREYRAQTGEWPEQGDSGEEA